jgi:DNA repair exonuclease SbcCD ATPase subunit
LIDQRDTLSSFAGKQKKLLQEQIDVLKEQLSELEVIIAQQKAEIEAKSAERINQLKADSKPLRDREEALKTEMEEINRELAKAR